MIAIKHPHTGMPPSTSPKMTVHCLLVLFPPLLWIYRMAVCPALPISNLRSWLLGLGTFY